MSELLVDSQYDTKGSPVRGLAGATLANFLGYSCVILLGGTGLVLQNAMNCNAKVCPDDDVKEVSNIQLGFLIGSPLLTGSLLRIPATILGDKFRHKRVMLCLLLLSLVGGLLLGGFTWNRFPWEYQLPGYRLLPSHYPVFFVAGCLIGCGASVYAVGIPHTAFWWSGAKQGKALGIYGGVGNMAPGVFHIILAFSIGTLGIPGSYMLLASIVAVGIFTFTFVGKDSWYFQLLAKGLTKDKAVEAAKAKGQTFFPPPNLVQNIKDAFRNKFSFCLGMMFLCSYGGMIAMGAWFPTYWIKMHILPGDTAKTSTTMLPHNSTSSTVLETEDETDFSHVLPLLLDAAFIFTAGLARACTGILSDKVLPMNLLGIGLVLQAASLGVLLQVAEFHWDLIFSELLAVGFGMTMAITFQQLPKRIPTAVSGATGIVGSMGAIGGFFFPPLMAMFSESYGVVGFRYGFSIILAMTVLAVIPYFILRLSPYPPAPIETVKFDPEAIELEKKEPLDEDTSSSSDPNAHKAFIA